jgi:Na+/H+-dicarboxylate symporter
MGKPLYKSLYCQVIIGVAFGITLGVVAPKLAIECKLLADIFLKLIKMMIAPVVFCTLVVGIAGSRTSGGKVGRVLLKAMILFHIFTIICLLLGVAAITLVKPGVGLNINPATLNTSSISYLTSSGAKITTLTDFVMHVIPTSYVAGLAQGDVLPVLLIAIMTGFSLNRAGKTGELLLEVIRSAMKMIFGIIGFIIKLAPLCAFGAMAFTVGRYGVGALKSLGQLIIMFYVLCAMFWVVFLGALCRFHGFSIFRLLAYIKEEIWITLGAASNEPAMPGMLMKMERLGCDRSVVGLTIPAAYAFNLDGTAIYLSFATLFIAQACNIHLSWGKILLMLAVMLISVKGSAGVYGAPLVALVATLSVFPDVPMAGITLIIGIDRMLAEARGTVTVPGHAVATIVTAIWEKSCDIDKLKAELKNPTYNYSALAEQAVAEESAVATAATASD